MLLQKDSRFPARAMSTSSPSLRSLRDAAAGGVKGSSFNTSTAFFWPGRSTVLYSSPVIVEH
jgi:hypothetical protein